MSSFFGLFLALHCCATVFSWQWGSSKQLHHQWSEQIFTHQSSRYSKDFAAEASDIRQLKESILAVSEGTNNGVNATPLQQEQLQALVTQLAPYNKITLREGADNQPMEGRWKLIFTTNREFSSGKVGPFVGTVIQDIDLQQRLYTNYLTLIKPNGGILDGRLQGTFENMPNENAWKVIFREVQLRIFNIPIFTKALPTFVGLWEIVYLDADFRIFYARNFNQNVSTPAADNEKPASLKRNLYVMQRVSPLL